jgi:glycosyltransferase involved in cell wall biosynthesis
MSTVRPISLRNERTGSFVSVVNAGSPELDYAADALAAAGLLRVYLRPYASRGRRWERLVSAAPGLSTIYRGTFGRRDVARGVSPERLVSAGVGYDFAYAALLRLGAHGLAPATRAARACVDRRARAIDRRATRLLAPGTLMLASAGTVATSAPLARAAGTRLVLNYPRVHPRTFDWSSGSPATRRLAAIAGTEELARRFAPEFAAADRVLLGSQYAADTFRAAGFDASRLAVIPYGVDTTLFAPGACAPRRGFQVLYVGRLTVLKGLEHLLDAFSASAEPDWTLRLVGNLSPDTPQLRVRRGRLEHMRNMPRTALPAVYREADVFVLPTLGEGLGLVALEAMACGLPIVVTPNGPGEVVRDGVDGFVVPAADAVALAERLRVLAESPDLRARMGAAARERSLAFGWPTYAQRVVELVEALHEEPVP